MTILARYQKLSITLCSYLKGKGYNRALEAFQYAKDNHPGFRKDGFTPNFQHQIEICLFIITLKELENEEETLIAALLHDVREDAGISDLEIERLFGKFSANIVEKLTKEFRGAKKTPEEYFKEISKCPIASVVKLADRIHNFSSMVGVFTIPKQEHYVFEVKEYFLPLCKKARKIFPHQQLSYYSMGTFLKNMLRAVEACLVAEKELIRIKEIGFKNSAMNNTDVDSVFNNANAVNIDKKIKNSRKDSRK